MLKWIWPLAALVTLSSCVGPAGDKPPFDPIDPPPIPVLENAAAAGVMAGPSLRSLGIDQADATAALAAYRASCNWPSEKDDTSGLTRREDWLGTCTAAFRWDGDALTFFETYFETARVGDGAAFATGYFEPEILGSRTRRPGYDVPVYKMPDDLVRAWPADMPESEREGRPPLGRYDETGTFVEYYTRAEIEDGALAGRGLEIAWAADAVEFFFLQIQGSGLLRTPDGEVMRIGYAGQNGHGYTGIGGLMRERGLLGDGPGQYPGSMQGIMQYIRENPEAGKALMRENESWVFFRELNTSGPLGSLGVPVTRGNSVAVDPRFVPYGAPVVLDMDRDIADGMWVAQDTGGAIKGANRFDTFWGNGGDSREVAGGMSARGTALILLPKGTLARLKAQ
ncbi:murein transglycosylase A [Alteriqipengyuania sp.]|uniref:murein transglycosylase A n=1 Tax=Alteriqipengyuania sp. TaxID=2800692 RepID=UPI00351816C0